MKTFFICIIHNFLVIIKILIKILMSYFKKSQKRTIPLPTVADDVILAIQAMDLSQSLISNKENNYKIKDEKSDTNEDNNSNTTELNSYSGSLTPTTSTCSTSESVKTRNPKCARCQNHGEEVLVKGHKRKCKHRECICERCILTVERQKLMAKTIRVKRRAKEDMIDPNMTDDQRFPKPVFKKHRSEISETDRESAYNSDSDKNKDMDTKLKEYFSMIENEIKKLKEMVFDHKLTLADIEDELIALKNNINHFIKERIQSKNNYKNMPFNGNPIIGSPIAPTNSTPTIPTVIQPMNHHFHPFESTYLRGSTISGSESNNNIDSFKIRQLNLLYYQHFLMTQKGSHYCPMP